ncbi:PmbA/TldA family metallopeptidase, partial [Ameyamaea chiangmaiensis]
MSISPSLISPLATTDALFFDRPGALLDRDTATRLVDDALAGMDDGELFLEWRESEMIALDDGTIRSASTNTSTGFGLRAVLGEETGFAHADELSEDALRRASTAVTQVRAGRSGTAA